MSETIRQFDTTLLISINGLIEIIFTHFIGEGFARQAKIIHGQLDTALADAESIFNKGTLIGRNGISEGGCSGGERRARGIQNRTPH